MSHEPQTERSEQDHKEAVAPLAHAGPDIAPCHKVCGKEEEGIVALPHAGAHEHDKEKAGKDCQDHIAVVDKASAKALIQSMFYEDENQEQDGNVINSVNSNYSTSSHNSNKNNTTSNITTNSQISKEPSEIKIELINGSGSTEKFEKAKQQLEDAGYNIKMTDKTKKIASTVITNKTNIKDEDVKKIKDVLGKGNISIMLAQTGIDVSIVIGEDFE